MEYKSKILVIEDDESLRKTIETFLQKEGYEVDSVTNGPDALVTIKNQKFDLIISDLKLPGGMEGIDILRKAKHELGYTGVMIIMTAFADFDTPVKAINLGVDDYIYKPFELRYFIHSIERSLRTYHLEKQDKENLERIKEMNEKLEGYNNKLAEKVEEKTRQLNLIFSIGREFTSSLLLEEVLSIIVDKIAVVLDAERCSILLLDEEKDEMFIAAAKGISEEIIKNTRIKKGENISGWIWENKQSILVKDIEKDHPFSKRNEPRYTTNSFISTVLVFKGKIIGIINVNDKRSRQIFNEEDLNFVKGIADYASIAIENARVYNNLEKVYLQVVETLTSIIDNKDNYTKGHSDRVAEYAVAIATSMGFKQNEIDDLRRACELHDLGKIIVSEYVLNKQDKLSESEWKEIKLHPTKAAEIIKPLKFLNGITDIIVQHHERYDGKGYPSGEKGESISLGARIAAVADSFDAMTSHRPYRKALSIKEALDELNRGKGTQFDPKIVDVFVKVVESNPQFFGENK